MNVVRIIRAGRAVQRLPCLEHHHRDAHRRAPQVARNERLSGYAGNAGVSKVQKLSDISLEALPRFSTGFKEFDRVLGGGVVPGSAILIGGNPGAANRRCCCKPSANWRKG